jgi:hypothetical protein
MIEGLFPIFAGKRGHHDLHLLCGRCLHDAETKTMHSEEDNEMPNEIGGVAETKRDLICTISTEGLLTMLVCCIRCANITNIKPLFIRL